MSRVSAPAAAKTRLEKMAEEVRKSGVEINLGFNGTKPQEVKPPKGETTTRPISAVSPPPPPKKAK
jgi:hypothetical protein